MRNDYSFFMNSLLAVMPDRPSVGVFFPLTGIGLLVFFETGFSSWHPLAKTSRTHQ